MPSQQSAGIHGMASRGQQLKRVLRLFGRHLTPVFFYSTVLYAALLLLPVYFQTITPGLDASWGFGLNYFPHSEFKFGPDLTFTYGPLGFVAVPMNFGANIAIAMFIRALVWALLLWQLVAIWRSRRRAAASIIVVSLILSNKLYLFYWDYLLAAATLVLCSRLLKRSTQHIELLLLAPLMGISFLVKFTSFMMAAMLLLVYVADSLLSRHRSSVRQRLLLAFAFASGPIAYLIYNPSIRGLLLYVKGAMEVSSGYAAWMSLPTETPLAIRGGVVCGIIVLWALVAVWRRSVPLSAATLALVATWVVFRHGFVRSGTPHSAVFFSFVILIFGVLLAEIRFTKRSAVIHGIVFSAFSLIALNGVSARWPVWDRFWWSADMNLTQAIQLTHPDLTIAGMNAATAANLKGTAIELYQADIQGSRLLVFPWDLAYAAPQAFTLVPLYATQAYVAVTRYLDRTSAEKIAASNPPIDFVLFEWKAIDGRHPLLDVPAIWTTLFSKYVPYVTSTNSVLLKRRLSPLEISYDPLVDTEFRPGAWVAVPQRSTPVGLSIDLRPTLRGALVTAMYKLPIIYLELRTMDGTVHTYRVPADVLATPLPFNCLPRSFKGLLELWSSNKFRDPAVAIRLTGDGLPYMRPTRWQFYDVKGTEVIVNSN